MTFWNFVKINVGMDIFCICFVVFFLLKIRKMNLKINNLENQLILSIKNPLAAKRRLKKDQ